MKRLLSLATLYPNAQAPRFGTFVARSLEALARTGEWEVTVINPIGIPPLAPGRFAARRDLLGSAAEHRVAVHRLPFTLLPGVSGPINPALIARAVLPEALRLHAEKPFDLIDAQFFYPDGPAAARIAGHLRLPFAIKARGADISYWGRKRLPLKQMRKAADGASRLLAVSQALKADMAALGFPEEKIEVHYTGLDRDLFRPLDRIECRRRIALNFGFTLPPGAPLLATVGALIERKGQALAIEALGSVPHAQLLLVGRGEDEAKLRAQAEEAGLGDRVHFLGSVDHTMLPVILSACNALVSPSVSEGLANAWVEALACGCPVVISDAGGAKELVTSDAAGRIVARDPGAIAAAVNVLLAAPPEPETVAAQVARFGWASHAAALDEIYSAVITR
ncbi:glycosyltransferase [Tsuneonella sp. HG222]